MNQTNSDWGLVALGKLPHLANSGQVTSRTHQHPSELHVDIHAVPFPRVGDPSLHARERISRSLHIEVVIVSGAIKTNTDAAQSCFVQIVDFLLEQNSVGCYQSMETQAGGMFNDPNHIFVD